MMNRRPTRTETLLRELAGHGLLGAIKFTSMMALGIVALPLQLVFCIILGLYYAALLLHWNARTSIKAVNLFLESMPGRRDYD